MAYTSMRNLGKIVGGLVMIGASFMVSCSQNEPLPLYRNPNLSDTTGLNAVRDLFVSVEMDQVPLEFFNGVNGYSNWSVSNVAGPCGAANEKFLQVHTSAFIIPELRKSGIYIDFIGCVANDSLGYATSLDSIFVVGEYPFYPKENNGRSAAVRYIDSDSNLWSTAFGANAASFSEFALSAVVENAQDSFSHYIAFGRFEGYLYSSSGDDSIQLKLGQFKGRIVQ